VAPALTPAPPTSPPTCPRQAPTSANMVANNAPHAATLTPSWPAAFVMAGPAALGPVPPKASDGAGRHSRGASAEAGIQPRTPVGASNRIPTRRPLGRNDSLRIVLGRSLALSFATALYGPRTPREGAKREQCVYPIANRTAEAPLIADAIAAAPKTSGQCQ